MYCTLGFRVCLLYFKIWVMFIAIEPQGSMKNDFLVLAVRVLKGGGVLTDSTGLIRAILGPV